MPELITGLKTPEQLDAKREGGKRLAQIFDELKEFAQNNDVKLDCYQNYQKEHRCSFNDPLSIGGTTSRPTQLTVIFKVQDSTVVSHEFTQTQAVNK